MQILINKSIYSCEEKGVTTQQKKNNTVTPLWLQRTIWEPYI